VSYTAAAVTGVVVTVLLDLFVLRTRLLLRRETDDDLFRLEVGA